MRRHTPTTPAYEILWVSRQFYARIDPETGHEIDVDKYGRQWSHATVEISPGWGYNTIDRTSYDGTGDYLYSLGDPTYGNYFLRRHDVLTGGTVWTVDYMTAFKGVEELGVPERISVRAKSDSLDLVLHCVEINQRLGCLATRPKSSGEGCTATSSRRCRVDGVEIDAMIRRAVRQIDFRTGLDGRTEDVHRDD